MNLPGSSLHASEDPQRSAHGCRTSHEGAFFETNSGTQSDCYFVEDDSVRPENLYQTFSQQPQTACCRHL